MNNPHGIIRPRHHTAKLARVALMFMTRRWFVKLGERQPDPVLSRLLMNIYCEAELGNPLSKKEAWTSIGIEDVKTGRKYIARAIELGLVTIKRSDADKRKELLLPTDDLRWAVEDEMDSLYELTTAFVNELSQAQAADKTASEEKRRQRNWPPK